MEEKPTAFELLNQIIAYNALIAHKFIDYYSEDLRHFKADPLPGPITVISHRSDEKRPMIIKTPKRDITFETGYFKASGVEIEYNGQVLASAQERYILIHFDPQALLDAVEDDRALFVQIMDELISKGIEIIEEYKALQQETECERWVRARQLLFDKKIQRLEERLEDCRNEIDHLRTKLRLEYHKHRELCDLIKYYKSFTSQHWKRKAKQEYESIIKLVPQTYTGIRFDDRGIEAITPPIHIKHNGFDYFIGKFRIWIDLESEVINFSNLDGTVQGHPHPHIDTDGNACWGNIESDISRLLAESDAYGLLVLCMEFLRSYFPDNPFLKIEHWDPNYSEEEEELERYRECYESSSPIDCVECTDSDCPYYEDAFLRCHEASDTYTCATCSVRDCPYHREELENCQSMREKYPWECVSCSSDECEFAGNEQACFELHQGERCSNCLMTSCSFHPSKAKAQTG